MLHLKIMHWQDFVLIIGQIAFTVSLLPSIFSKDKPALTTSLISGVVLAVFSFVYISLSLYLAALGTAATGALWFILAFQKYSTRSK